MRLHARPHGSQKQIGIFGLTLLMMVVALAPNASAGAGGTPVPFVQAISPVSVAPGGNSFTLTVTGANFVPASAAFLGIVATGDHVCVVDEADCDGVRSDD